jgi:hypothetical protein
LALLFTLVHIFTFFCGLLHKIWTLKFRFDKLILVSNLYSILYSSWPLHFYKAWWLPFFFFTGILGIFSLGYCLLFVCPKFCRLPFSLIRLNYALFNIIIWGVALLPNLFACSIILEKETKSFFFEYWVSSQKHFEIC